MNYNDNYEIKELQQWGNVQWFNDLSSSFQGCPDLQITATDIPNFSNVTSMAKMFSYCYAITTIPNINQWNVSNVTDMSSLFSSCTNFNAPIGSWNVSNVTNMFSMFSSADNFNSDISNWNVSNVTNMQNMFYYATNFNGNLSSWNVSNVTNMSSMFQSAYNFNSNISNWNVSNATQIYNMFTNAFNFNQDLGSWDIKAYNLLDFLSNTGMTCENYSKTLMGWANNPNFPQNGTMKADNILYGPQAQTYRNILINTKGWSISGDVYDSSCVTNLANQEISAANPIKLYPTPTTGELFIESLSKTTAQLFDMTGKKVKELSLNKGKNTIDLRQLINGMYIINIDGKPYKVIKK
ncbi:BspA family leucine-rich repeat surface protein [Amniculibacterium aquaticum]|uniref:BspA family leucine-rich repeat surface protein n=1 Tax=Amniculibacterium aquaticum TaxID=2479858 RepID=UPI000F5AD2BD|nr:BspA family leucine-rich repeat surface protein [Amniculibacterium aquaticum]